MGQPPEAWAASNPGVTNPPLPLPLKIWRATWLVSAKGGVKEPSARACGPSVQVLDPVLLERGGEAGEAVGELELLGAGLRCRGRTGGTPFLPRTAREIFVVSFHCPTLPCPPQ